MADKIDVKLILGLRHISTKSVAAVWKRADALGGNACSYCISGSGYRYKEERRVIIQ